MSYDRRSYGFFFLENPSCIEPLRSLSIFLPGPTYLLFSISLDMADHLWLFLMLTFGVIT